MSVQLCVFASSSKTQDTMWKLKNFPAFNFLREINFSQWWEGITLGHSELSLNFTQNLMEKFLNLHTVHVYYTLCKWKKFSLTMRKCHTSHKRSARLFFVTPWQCDKSFYFDYKNIIVDDPESRWSGFWFTYYSLMNMS